MRRALLVVLALSFASTASALTVERIGSTVRHHASDVRVCYVHALRLRPDLAGRIEIRFTVEPAGNVSAAAIASDTVGDRTMSACVLGVVRGWQFPVGDERETVTYPFQFAH